MSSATTAPDPWAPQVWPGRAYPLGATFDGSGTNFALFSSLAQAVDLCLLDGEGHETRVALTEVDANVWHCYLPWVRPVSTTDSGSPAPMTPPQGTGATPRSCCSTPTPRRSRAM